MIKIKKLKDDFELKEFVKDLKSKIKSHNLDLLFSFYPRYYVTEDIISLVIYAGNNPMIRLDYSISFDYASIFKFYYFTTHDAIILSVYEKIIRKLLTTCAD